jgi:hypothetical protein
MFPGEHEFWINQKLEKNLLVSVIAFANLSFAMESFDIGMYRFSIAPSACTSFAECGNKFYICILLCRFVYLSNYPPIPWRDSISRPITPVSSVAGGDDTCAKANNNLMLYSCYRSGKIFDNKNTGCVIWAPADLASLDSPLKVAVATQVCQIFLGKTYQNGKKL